MEAVTSPIINNYLTFVNENNLKQYKILFYKKTVFSLKVVFLSSSTILFFNDLIE